MGSHTDPNYGVMGWLRMGLHRLTAVLVMGWLPMGSHTDPNVGYGVAPYGVTRLPPPVVLRTAWR